MFILWAIAAAAALVCLGYFALLGTLQPNVSQGMSKFGKIIAIALFIIAGLVVIFTLAQNLFRRNPMMGRPAYNYGAMMQRQQGMNPYANMQNRPNFGQPGQVAVPIVTPNQPNTGAATATKKGQVPAARKAK